MTTKAYKLFLITLFSCLFLSACATSHFTAGKDFPSKNISKIKKGETTTAQALEMFGAPFSKSVISENEEKWIYTYSKGVSTAQSYIVTMKVETKGVSKTLDLLFKDGVVINYTYTEGNTPYSGRIN